MLQPVVHDRTRWWSREDVILIILLGALLFLPGLGDLPLIDRDEARFATAGRNMVETGDYIVPRLNENLRPDKPPLIYWLQAAVFHVSRQFSADAAFTEITARLPSALCSMGTLLVVYFAAGRRFGRVTGLVAAMMTGSAAVFLMQSRMSTADASMVFFSTLAMACASRAFESTSGTLEYRRSLPKVESLDPAAALDFSAMNPPRESAQLPLSFALAFWLALGLATLAKGVPILFVPLSLITLSILAGRLGTEVRLHLTSFFRRRNVLYALSLLPLLALFYAFPQLEKQRGWLSALWVLLCLGIALPNLPSYIVRYGGNRGRWGWWLQLRPLLGIPLLLAVVLPWFIAAWMQTHGVLIQIMIGKHLIARATSDLEGHSMPPGFFLATIWAGFWPWSILLIPAGFHVTRRLLGKTAVHIDPRPYQFLVCWIIPVWLVLELAKTKLIHYPLPLYIPLAILCADTLVQSWLRLTDVLAAPWFKSARVVTVIIWGALGIAAAVATKLYLPPALFGWSILFAGALIAAGIASAIAWSRPSWPFVIVLTWIAALFVAETLILPYTQALQVSKNIGNVVTLIRKDIPKEDPNYRVAALGYVEDSLVFYCHTPIAKPGAENIFPQIRATPAKNQSTAEWIHDLAQSLDFDESPATTTSSTTTSSSSAPATLPHPRQKWILILDQPTRDEFDRQHIPYYSRLDYKGLPTTITGFNIAKGQPVTVSIITNSPPDYWLDTPTRPATADFTLPAK